MTPIYYRCRKMRFIVGKWSAWCGLKKLCSDSALFEPQAEIFFNMGETEEEAIANLRKCVPSEYARREWIRQETP